jgi:hypothetical protein
MKKYLLMVMLVLAVMFAAPRGYSQVPAIGPSVVNPAPVVPNPLVSLLTDSRTYDALLTFSAAIFAWWKQSKLTTSKKALVAVVKGVEFATSLPEVQQFEQTVKAAISKQALALGVQDDLHKIVQNVTVEPAAKTSGSV